MTIYCSPVQVYQTGLLKAFPWLVSIPGYLKSQFQDGDLLVSRGSGKSDKEIVNICCEIIERVYWYSDRSNDLTG